MSEQLKTITRQELYEKVWKVTLKKVAEELGINYVELAQLCEKLNIPKPLHGHWRRLELKLPVEQIPLPAPGSDTPLEVTIQPRKIRTKIAQPSVERRTPQKESPDTSSQPNAVQVGPVAEPQESRKMTVVPTPQPDGLVSYSRDQLYEAIWSTPCQKLAASLGISDVALAKTCKRLGIPRPSLGYWARVAAGEKLPRVPLPPPQQGQNRLITFDVAANRDRRREWAAMNITSSELEQVAVRLELPDNQVPLHPLAQKHLRALEKEKPAEDGLVRIARMDLFQCEIAQASIERLCRALDTLIRELEGRGYKFRASTEQYWNLRVVKGDDFMSIRCSEGRENLEREPTPEEKRQPSWTWKLKSTRPTGRFSFEIRTSPCLRGRHTWSETERQPLEEVLGIIAEKVDYTFRAYEEERQREVERAKLREEEERREAERRKEENRRSEERQRQDAERKRLESHKRRLAEIAEKRREVLIDVAMQMRLHEELQSSGGAGSLAAAACPRHKRIGWLGRVQQQRACPLLRAVIPTRFGTDRSTKATFLLADHIPR